MSTVRNGLAVSEGISSGTVRKVEWQVPDVPHSTVEPEHVEDELARFEEVRSRARDRLLEIQEATRQRLGKLEARIFDPQLLMLDDVEVVEGTVRYIRENRLSAARAYHLRMLEIQALWIRTGNPMILDRLNDLEDVMSRVLRLLLDLPEPGDITGDGQPAILVARNLTPSITVQMDPQVILAIATDQGTRTSHWAILARSMEIPAVAGLVDISRVAREGQEAILDGRVGRVVLDPDARDREVYSQRKGQILAWEEELAEIARLDAVTLDGQPVALRANLDIPAETVRAVQYGAEGVGLFRTEFLVVGRNAMPEEEEQYEAYREIAEAFPNQAVVIRTFDLGGDKFPMFLHMPAEENPFLGWRAIRVCLDRLELFRPQLRAILRASAHGDVRILLPLVNDVEEVVRVRELLAEEEVRLKEEGIPFHAGYKLGVLVETPAAALDAAELARHCDFFSIGTNDLIQYTLAVDRGNPAVNDLYQASDLAVLRLIERVVQVAQQAGVETSLCGQMSSSPQYTMLLLGFGLRELSVAPGSIPEIKQVCRSVTLAQCQAVAARVMTMSGPPEINAYLCAELEKLGLGDGGEAGS